MRLDEPIELVAALADRHHPHREVGHPGVGERMQALPDRRLAPGHQDVADALGVALLEQLLIVRARPRPRTRSRLVRATAASISCVAAQAHRDAGHDAGGRPAGGLGGPARRGHDVGADGPLVGHPQDGPVGPLTAQLQHPRPQRRQEDRGGADVGDVEGVVHPEPVVLDVDRARAGQGLVEHVEVGPHGGHGMLVGQTEHLVDDPVVGDAEADGQAALADGLHGEDVLGQGDGVAGLDRHHRRTDLDAGRLGADHGGGGQGVELVGDLRDPDGGQSGLLRPAGVGQEPLHLGPVAATLGADHQADAHALCPPCAGACEKRTYFFFSCHASSAFAQVLCRRRRVHGITGTAVRGRSLVVLDLRRDHRRHLAPHRGGHRHGAGGWPRGDRPGRGRRPDGLRRGPLAPPRPIGAGRRPCGGCPRSMPDGARRWPSCITAEMGAPTSFSRFAQATLPMMLLEHLRRHRRGLRLGVRPCRGLRRGPDPAEGGHGVVVAIVPWNMPQFLIAGKLAPALLAGCPIIVKPAPETPLDALLLAELVDGLGLPPGVVSVLPGGREVGELLVGHPGVDKVAFTGSTAAGRQVAATCGASLTRVSLELGGKSAAIVLADADPAAVAQGVRVAGLMNSGQACVAQTRVLVPSRGTTSSSTHWRRWWRSCPPATRPTGGGDRPLVTQRQQERVRGFIETASRRGPASWWGARPSLTASTGDGT